MTTRSSWRVDGRPVSLLGYGAMRLPTVDRAHATGGVEGASKAAIDQELLNRQVKLLLDGGVNLFDTSPAYCRGESERCLGEALAASGYKRSDYFLSTKLSNFAPPQQTLAGSKALFANSLKCLRTDYLDLYILHHLAAGGMKGLKRRFIDNGVIDWLCAERRAGRIRNLGFSVHGDRDVWDWCMANHAKYRWDFALIQLNYVDWAHATEVSNCFKLVGKINAKDLYADLAARQIPALVMEPLLGGRLARYNYAVARELQPLDPSASLASWAFRFAASHGNVLAVLSGMTRTEHIEENLRTFSPLRKLNAAEFAALERAADALNRQQTVDCNDCKYCMPCPYGLDIPAIFAFRNEVLSSPVRLQPREILRLYAARVPEPLRRADHCTGCGRCVPHCPQGLDIPRELAKIDKWIDEVKNEVAQLA